MKIAVITDDCHTVSAHFGRARHFLVYTVREGEIMVRELRDKAGHDTFAGHEHDHGERGHREQHTAAGKTVDHEHHEHLEHHGRHDPRGHGFGHGSGRRHARMLATIDDCDVLLARGMGHGAYLALQRANITPITTEIKSIEEAVQAYLSGDIVDRPERRH